ncbi:MAG TPA: endonuclease domain-containing protein [Ferruginibacter sp.]|jgi:cyclase|nr:endonuclease domain-containing protein [Ferruginibacter sp.]
MKQKMFYGASHIIFANANSLRKRTTEAEKILWNYLRGRFEGFKFRRQHPLGIYIADFYCHKAKLVIELDGTIHDIETIKENDKVRQRIIEEDGLKVIRFSNEQVFNEIQKVLKEIKSHLLT